MDTPADSPLAASFDTGSIPMPNAAAGTQRSNLVGNALQQEYAPGVASLDSAQLQQTKSEIRSLAAEIAKLADAPLEPDEFFAGFLPRLCSAMGASGACAWQIVQHAQPEQSSDYSLLGSHCAASELFSSSSNIGSTSPRPSEQHHRVLDGIVAEGQPILVPPGNVKLETQRPTNPLTESLIVVPVRVESSLDHLLEVVHRPSGGPTAQRGYLRFVAQMADLMADYLRRHRLRNVQRERQRFQRLSHCLTAIAAAPNNKMRLQLAADYCAELASAERAFILSGPKRPRVISVSGAREFDSRSLPVELCGLLTRSYFATVRSNERPNLQTTTNSDVNDHKDSGEESGDAHESEAASKSEHPQLNRWFAATDRRAVDASVNSGSAEENSANTGAKGKLLACSSRDGFQALVDDFCRQLRCSHVFIQPLRDDQSLICVLATAEKAPTTVDREEPTVLSRDLSAIGGLLDPDAYLPVWRRIFPTLLPGRQVKQGHSEWMVWTMRVAALLLLSVVACFPVTQSVSGTATLHPERKQAYYAAEPGVVTEIFVEDGQSVQAGDKLLQLRNTKLEMEADRLQSDYDVTQQRIADVQSRLRRGVELSTQETDQLESELQQLSINYESTAQQIDIVAKQLQNLTIRARSPGVVSAWDASNSLLNRPVASGEMLLSTFDPEGAWTLRIAVPDRRIGLVAEQMSSSSAPVQVQYSLSSHPELVLPAVVSHVATTATPQPELDSQGRERYVMVDAVVDSAGLPMRKDGAIARTTIRCGRVPAIWLVARDAYNAASSQVRMLW